MPIYEYFCPNNRKIYSFYARSLAYSSKTPRCPDNPKWKMEKLISGFAITGRASEKGEGGGDDAFDDPRMERAMAEMEREFASMGDTDNPDPRMLARAMRKLTEVAGEKVPEAMSEMIERLEKGEDPDKLEEEYGDALEDFDIGGDDDGGDPSAESASRKRKRKQGKITRDPTLYEMADYCD